jgi:hypothetical protein
MPKSNTDISWLTDLLTVIGSAGAVLGATVGAAIGADSWRQALERLAIGAATGGACGYLAAFVIYDLVRLLA